MALINISKDKREFKIVSKGKDTAEMILYGEVGGDFFGEGITAKMVSNELKKIKAKELIVRINSIGGDVFEGITIYNRLKQLDANVTIYIDGIAASIASIIALAGDKVIMGEGAMMMIHKPLTFIYGNSIELEAVINRLDEVEEQLLTIYNRRTGLDRIELREMLANETWLDATQAIELGFVDETIEQDEQLNISACLDGCKWFKNKPKVKNVDREIRSKVKDFKKEIKEYLARK